ncbi:thiamine phosphate synthase [Meiothermus rufus]|uniref:thiamine phosphate synthase n=1 Tax=Meiothermus rufus TaxID=604332 RepID=UPI00041C916E|nr:thiamine phosphate synthase [Meiothermus rufus]
MLGRLYLVVTPRPGWTEAYTLDRTERALAGGVEVVQLRAKDWEARPTLSLGEKMKALAERYGVPFILNDRPDLAALLEADGVHLGQGDLTPREARRFFQGLVGRSTHAPGQAMKALEEGADYLSVGPVWETPTKPGRQATGLGYVRWAAENLEERPWFAIGGIDLESLDQVLEAGARRVVVVRAILDAPDPEGAARAFRRRLDALG